jgi:hypothetical protein
MFFLVLAIAMPKVFHALEDTILAFLHLTQTVFSRAETFSASAYSPVEQLELMVPTVSY